MIKFFRKIRQNLLSEGKIGKYLKYAIGEIVLVVIGILIALSINNLNEQKKESVLEKVYLEGIRDDLEKDVEQANSIIEIYLTPLNIVNNIEPRFNLDTTLKLENVDTTNLQIPDLFRRRNSFRSAKGTYSSLISDGKSNLIKNKILFQKIQSIYDEQQVRIFSIYDYFKSKENHFTSEYSYEKYNWNYETLTSNGNEKARAALANFWDPAQFYCIYLNALIPEMKIVIDEINVELKK